jgi:hypothetical protein
MSNDAPLKWDPNTVTGTAGRDMRLTAAIMTLEQRGDDPAVLASVQLELPQDFDLDATELSDMLDHMNIVPGGTVAVPDPAEDEGEAEAAAFAKHREGQRRPLVPTVESPTITADEARDSVVLWEKRLAQARGARLGADQKARDLRGKLATAMQEFVAGFAQLTPEQNAREMIASEQARKAAGIPLNGGRARTGGPSVVDQSAGSADGSSANRRYGSGFRRGAYTKPGGLNFDPRRGPVAKLPSQR